MAIVIRTLYNNRNWQAPCTSPYKDKNCWLCFRPNVNIKPPSVNDVTCSGHCWEQHICTSYRWGCTPQGNKFGDRAYAGMNVFLVFKQTDGKYTLWGKTSVRDIDDRVMLTGKPDEHGFSFIHFNPFKPLPKDKWVRNLAAIQLVGKPWGQGRYRYIQDGLEANLQQLI